MPIPHRQTRDAESLLSFHDIPLSAPSQPMEDGQPIDARGRTQSVIHAGQGEEFLGFVKIVPGAHQEMGESVGGYLVPRAAQVPPRDLSGLPRELNRL